MKQILWRVGLVSMMAALFLVAQPPAAAKEGGGFKNLQVLDPDIEKDQLKGIMKGFTKMLGVKCSFCHVPDEYELDDKDNKKKAREMIRLVVYLRQNVDTYFPPDTDPNKIGCWTCHRGSAEIEVFVPEEED